MQIIDSYVDMFNSDWMKNKEMKHAISAVQGEWVRNIGKEWLKTSRPWWKLCHDVAQKLVGADMVKLQS